MATKAGSPGPRGHDLIEGPIGRTLLLFALPTLGGNILQSLNGSINAVWVGRFLGEGALAATSNANLIMFLMFALGFGFGMAATVLMGQAMGRREIDVARRTMGSAFGLFALVSVVIAVGGWIGAPALLKVLATPPAARDLALVYLRTIFLALPPMFLGVLISMALRAVGDAMTPLFFLLLGAALDAGLNPLLIRGIGPFPRMGIAGSATATLVANYVVLAAGLGWIYARDLPIRLRGPELRYLIPEAVLLRTIFSKGLAMGLQMVVMSLSGLITIGLVNRLGVDTTAAYGVAQQLWAYVQMPALALGAAVSAMAAQNIGAGRWDRVGRITRAGLIGNIGMTGLLVALLLLFDRPAMVLFLGPTSPAVPIARHIQFIASWSFVLFGATLVLFSTVRANGAVVAPLLILTFGVVVARIGIAWSLLPRLGADIIWWSFPLGSAITVGLAALYYRYGGWRGGQMLPPERPVPVPPDEAHERTLADAEPGGRLHPAG